MNFHALLRVDKSKKMADKFQETEKVLTDMISKIVWNKNLILDKKILKFDKNKPALNIYIGNDYGFCGNFNSSINRAIFEDTEAYKIIIGKKIYAKDDKVLFNVDKDNFLSEYHLIDAEINRALLEKKYSSINVIYNHYYSFTEFEFTRKKIFPFEFEKQKNEIYNEDFAVETDINKLVNDLIALYISYEIKICEMNSSASENIMREKITEESLDKIEEFEQIEMIKKRKEKKDHDFKKSIDNSRKL